MVYCLQPWPLVESNGYLFTVIPHGLHLWFIVYSGTRLRQVQSLLNDGSKQKGDAPDAILCIAGGYIYTNVEQNFQILSPVYLPQVEMKSDQDKPSHGN